MAQVEAALPFPSPLGQTPGVKKSVSHELEGKLNPEQIAAVTHGEGPQLVLAGAGSGKTRVITYRIYWLVEEMGVDPGTIAAMTFTNKAAGEMRERVEELLDLHPLPTSVGTFHRYGLLLLRRYGERVGLRRDFHVLDGSDQIGLVKEALTAEGLSETAFSPRSVLSQISAAKNRLIDAAGLRGAGAELLREEGRRPLPALPGAAQRRLGGRLRRPDRAAGQAPVDRRGDQGAGPPLDALPAGRRVPGHQPRPAPADPGAHRPGRQPHRRGRRGPGDLPLARRRPQQHPGVREDLPRAPPSASWSRTTAPPRPSSTSPAR